MQTWRFTITLVFEGNTPADAWDEAQASVIHVLAGVLPKSISHIETNDDGQNVYEIVIELQGQGETAEAAWSNILGNQVELTSGFTYTQVEPVN